MTPCDAIDCTPRSDLQRLRQNRRGYAGFGFNWSIQTPIIRTPPPVAAAEICLGQRPSRSRPPHRWRRPPPTDMPAADRRRPLDRADHDRDTRTGRGRGAVRLARGGRRVAAYVMTMMPFPPRQLNPSTATPLLPPPPPNRHRRHRAVGRPATTTAAAGPRGAAAVAVHVLGPAGRAASRARANYAARAGRSRNVATVIRAASPGTCPPRRSGRPPHRRRNRGRCCSPFRPPFPPPRRFPLGVQLTVWPAV